MSGIIVFYLCQGGQFFPCLQYKTDKQIESPVVFSSSLDTAFCYDKNFLSTS